MRPAALPLLCLAAALALGLVAAEDEVDVIIHAAIIFARGSAIDQDQTVRGELDHVAIVAD